MKKNYEEIIKTETTYGSKTKGIKKIFKTFAMLGTSAVLAFGALGLVGCNNKNDNSNVSKPPVIDQPVDEVFDMNDSDIYMLAKGILYEYLTSPEYNSNCVLKTNSFSTCKLNFESGSIIHFALNKNSNLIKLNEKTYEKTTYSGTNAGILKPYTENTTATYFDGTNSHSWETSAGSHDLTQSIYSVKDGRSDNSFDRLNKYLQLINNLPEDYSEIKISHNQFGRFTISININNLPYSVTLNEILQPEDYVKAFMSIESLSQTLKFTFTNHPQTYLIVDQDITYKGNAKELSFETSLNVKTTQHLIQDNTAEIITPPIPNQKLNNKKTVKFSLFFIYL